MMVSAKGETIQVLAAKGKGGGKVLSLPAGASLEAVREAPDCTDLLRRTLSGTLPWPQRTGITVEQAILSPSLAPQWIAALLALDAEVVFGKRATRLADFLPRSAAKQEKLAAVHVPLDVPGRAWGEAHVARMPADEPIVAAMAVIDLADEVVTQARVALTGAWPTQARLAEAAGALVGEPLTDARIAQAAGAVAQEVEPVGDFRGSAEYRRAMAAVLTRRAVQQCKEGA
jgi:CO/xanthine dehydrogenase FAD-binding subunit